MHEQLDPVGLVHMNGRVYDPELGRFMSPDIVIQDVTNLQSLNAYSYVLNNPLSLTDPSGYFFSGLIKAIKGFFKAIFRAIGQVFKAILNSQIGRAFLQIAACTFGPAACVAASAAITLATGGSIVDAIQAAAFTFISAGVWTEVGSQLKGVLTGLELGEKMLIKGVVHGVVGGAMSMAQGGSFMDGFAANSIGAAAGLLAGSGSFGKLGSPDGLFVRTAIAATAGGLAAEITGGKFSNGAITAGMAHLFNAEKTAAEMAENSADETPEKPSCRARTCSLIAEGPTMQLGGRCFCSVGPVETNLFANEPDGSTVYKFPNGVAETLQSLEPSIDYTYYPPGTIIKTMPSGEIIIETPKVPPN